MVCIVHSPPLRGAAGPSRCRRWSICALIPPIFWPGPCDRWALVRVVCTLRLHCFLGGECWVIPSPCPLPLPSGRLSVPSPTAGSRAGLPSSQAGSESPSCNQLTPPLPYPWEQLENGFSPCPTHALTPPRLKPSLGLTDFSGWGESEASK